MNGSAQVAIEAEAGDRPRRRKHSIVEKRRIVEATLVAGASVGKRAVAAALTFRVGVGAAG
jgi:hypothetical protein